MALRVQVVTSVFSGGPGYNTFYSSGTNATDADTLVNNVFDLYSAFADRLSNITEVDISGTVEIFDPTNGQTTGTHSISPTHIDGTWGSGQAPAGTCVLLQWRTGIYANGREVRGRSFISGLGDFAAGAPGVPATEHTDFNSAANNYATQPQSCVYSPTNGGLYNMFSGGAWNKFGLMRSRRD